MTRGVTFDSTEAVKDLSHCKKVIKEFLQVVEKLKFMIKFVSDRYLWIPDISQYTEVESFIGSKVECMFCFEICTPEGRGGEKVGSANFQKTQNQEITPPLYSLRPHIVSAMATV